jgi:hypothetical protein
MIFVFIPYIIISSLALFALWRQSLKALLVFFAVYIIGSSFWAILPVSANWYALRAFGGGLLEEILRSIFGAKIEKRLWHIAIPIGVLFAGVENIASFAPIMSNGRPVALSWPSDIYIASGSQIFLTMGVLAQPILRLIIHILLIYIGAFSAANNRYGMLIVLSCSHGALNAVVAWALGAQKYGIAIFSMIFLLSFLIAFALAVERMRIVLSAQEN